MKNKVFGVWFVIFLIWAFYRAGVFLPEAIDEFFVKPAVFVLPVLYIVLVREKKSLKNLGLQPKLKDLMLDLYIGVVVGVLFALEGMLTNYIKYGQLSFLPIMALKISGGILPFLIINLSSALWEEILARGFLYKRLYKISGKQFNAAFTSSFLFLLLHIPIMFTRLHLMGASLIIYPVSILLLGITNCYLFSLRKSLVLPVLIHAFWNMTVALYL